MDIITKAQELGKLIAASEPMTALKAAESRMERDSKAKKLFEEHKILQVKLSIALRDNMDSKEVNDINEALEQKQREIEDYEVTKHFLEAKAAFDAFMKTINDIMIFTITGEVPCSSSGSCGTCGGCNH